MAIQIKATVSVAILLFALAITYTTAARHLNEDESALPNPVVSPPLTGVPSVGPSTSSTASGTTGVSPVGPAAAAVTISGTGVPSVGPAAGSTTGAVPSVGPATGPAGPAGGELVFFMHDILSGTIPTAVAVTGVASNPAGSGQVPFAKPNGANLPINNGIPVNNNNNGIVNNNNIPFLAGLSGNVANIQNNFNLNPQVGVNSVINGGGQGSQGALLQQLMFGTLTVIDDELTEGHELGSGLIGKAQGFYVASDVDGKSHTMGFTAMFENGGYADSISFFGVLRTAVSESQIAIMGGTGKYVNAKAFATVKVFSGSNGQLQQSEGVETLLQFTVYLA